MGKISDAYKSLVRGVSQQVPEQRLPGQHGEQVNVLSDPVRGLVRRQGTTLVRENVLPATAGLSADLSTNFTEWDVKVEDDNYTLLTRRAGTSGTAHHVFPVVRGGAQDGALLPVVSSAGAASFLTSGINGVAVTGRYLVLAHNQPTTVVETPVWDLDLMRRRAQLYLRGGTYARKYKVTIKLVGQPEMAVTYTTPTSSYPGVLDTSDISYGASDYVKQVNDRVNAYNGAVTQWIGTAAAAVQPAAIAEQIRLLLVAAGLPTHGILGIQGAVINIQLNAGVAFEYITVDDGGDGTQLKYLWREVDDPSDLPPLSWAGNTIKVAPSGKEAYYLVAVSTGAGAGVVKVTWEEGPATTAVLSNLFLLGTVEAGTLYIGESPAALQALVPSLTVPTIGDRKVGDADTSPVPHFAGRAVTHCGMFQDRLFLVADNVIAFSRIGDYFNFWRSTALSVLDDDVVEVYGNGSEDDTIRHSVFFDRGLVLFGDRQQYAIGGSVPLTPSTATVVQSSAHKDAAGVRPVALGDLVFYAKTEQDFAHVYQISVGAVDDTSISTDVSQQIDTYLLGSPRALAGVSMPSIVALRTTGKADGFYLFRYVDAGQQRLLDAWATWEFAAQCGNLAAISTWQDRLRLLFVRTIAGVPHLVVDEALLTPGTRTLPHLDSMKAVATRPIQAGMHCAWGANPVLTRAWQGSTAGDVAELTGELGNDALLMGGFPFPAYVDLTSPHLRDKEDAPITLGRTVVNRLVMGYAQTGAFDVVTTSPFEVARSLEFRGLSVNGLSSFVGQRNLQTGRATAPIGREVRQYTARISAHEWQPFAITTIDWVGQLFNNTRRI